MRRIDLLASCRAWFTAGNKPRTIKHPVRHPLLGNRIIDCKHVTRHLNQRAQVRNTFTFLFYASSDDTDYELYKLEMAWRSRNRAQELWGPMRHIKGPVYDRLLDLI